MEQITTQDELRAVIERRLRDYESPDVVERDLIRSLTTRSPADFHQNTIKREVRGIERKLIHETANDILAASSRRKKGSKGATK